MPFTTIDPTRIGDNPSDTAELIAVVKDLRNAMITVNENTRLLLHQIGINSTDIATIGGNHSALEALVQNLETILIRTQADVSRLTPGGTSKKVKLKEPSKFDGSDKNKAVSF